MFTDGQRGTETRLLEFDVCGAFALSAGALTGQTAPAGMGRDNPRCVEAYGQAGKRSCA